MRKIVFFATTKAAFETLSNLNHINKDLLVTIDEYKAKKINLTEYSKELQKLDFKEIYFVDKYSMKSQKDFEFFNSYRGDIGIILGWNRLIPKNIINTFKYGIIGFHGTPYGLPQGKGRSPVIWSLVLGEKKYYFYAFLINENIDDGLLLDEQIIDLNDFDTADTVYKKIVIVLSRFITDLLPKFFNNEIKPYPQPIGESTYFRKREFNDGKINWIETTNSIYNLVRALSYPGPNAHTFFNEFLIKIEEAQPFSERLFTNSVPGEILFVFSDDSLVVKTGDSSILIKKYISPIKLEKGMFLK